MPGKLFAIATAVIAITVNHCSAFYDLGKAKYGGPFIILQY